MTDTDEEYEENIEENIISIYDKPFSIDDEFIIYFQKEGEVFGKIKSIEIDERKVLLSIDTDEYFLEMNDDEQILLKTSDYEINDIEKVIEFASSALFTNDTCFADDPELSVISPSSMARTQYPIPGSMVSAL